MGPDSDEVDSSSNQVEVERIEIPPATNGHDLTHGLFRYPAKFHPPVVGHLLRRYTHPGETILDPFCGSGTLMVEASATGRLSVGTDVDPLAIAISRAKTRRYDIEVLDGLSAALHEALAPLERSPNEYELRMHEDLTELEYEQELGDLWVPAIPRLHHWFRKYVSVDLAKIRHEIASMDADASSKDLFFLVFASILRNASNADPVPVSGLEVTSHMLKRDAEGRNVNPFALFRAKSKRTLRAIANSSSLLGSVPEPEVFMADATSLTVQSRIDGVITSPPYHNAVDYYRRHQLEMFWLQLTESQADRLELLPRYIGKARIAHSNPALAVAWNPSPVALAWEAEIAKTSPSRARDFRAYLSSMGQVFGRLEELLPAGAPAIFVVGRSSWNGDSIPTDALFVELAHGAFSIEEHLTYPVKNRYMSYSRHNGASIDLEHVLVLRRRP